MEEWKDVSGFEGFYRVSNTGLVSSSPRSGLDGSRKRKGRILKPWANKTGQVSVDFMVYGERTRFLVSRLVAAAFIGNIGKGKVVAHLDLKKDNNNVSNLEIMERKEMQAIVNSILCDYEYISMADMTREKVREFLNYENGDLFWKKRTALGVEIGTRAGESGEFHEKINFCGETYMKGRIVYLYHHGVLPDYVLPKNNNSRDCRINNLFGCTASQFATIFNRYNNLKLQ